MKSNSDKPLGVADRQAVYRGPDMIEVGSVIELTRAGDTPVRDNNNDELRTYYNANPPITGDEVDLGDR